MNDSNGHFITLDNRQYAYFSGNNYLGLANHPNMIREVISHLPKYGMNFSASRKTTGTSELHVELEQSLARFKQCDDTVLFASGYVGNSILFRTLRDQYSMVFIDSKAHPSILDGIPRDIKNVQYYNHLDTNHLELLLKQSKDDRSLIVTDGVFALTGEIAPLDLIQALATKYHALVIVDDAHSTGILGENGRGTHDHFDLQDTTNIYQSETMSKAIGSYGGFISSSREVIHKIRSNSTFYAASTALPPPLVLAGIFAIKQIKKHPELRLRLLENAQLLKTGIKNLGFKTTHAPTPIIPMFFEERQKAEALSKYLQKEGFIVPHINYPVKIERSMLRMTASANHTKEQINELLYYLRKWNNNNGNPY